MEDDSESEACFQEVKEVRVNSRWRIDFVRV